MYRSYLTAFDTGVGITMYERQRWMIINSQSAHVDDLDIGHDERIKQIFLSQMIVLIHNVPHAASPRRAWMDGDAFFPSIEIMKCNALEHLLTAFSRYVFIRRLHSCHEFLIAMS